MKLLATLALISLAASAAPEVPDDDPPPPFECPLCGGDPVAHKWRVAGLTYLHGRLAVEYVGAFFQTRSVSRQ